MTYSKEEYERLINNSPIFEVDKEKDIALYRRARYNLLCLITDYYRLHIYKNRMLEDYSLTLMETADECIKYYQREKGDFINLLNHNMKRNFGIAKAKEAADKYRQGITLSEKNEKMIRAIVAYVKSKNLDLRDTSIRNKIATALKMPADLISELLAMNENATVQSSVVRNDDGEEVELFDLRQDPADTPEKKAISRAALTERLGDIETAFNSTQNRQKKLLSMLLTAKLLDEFGEIGILFGRAFYDESVSEFYKQSGQVLTAKQIAEKCGVSEQSVSRTYKNFIAKIMR